MTPRLGLVRAVRPFALGLAFAGVLAVCSAPTQAFEPPLGSKNFTSPSFVPNYFSNEAAPFGRGSPAAQPAADRFNTAPAPAAAGYAATSETSPSPAASAVRQTYRGKPARAGTGHAKSASSRTVRGYAGGARGSGARVHGAHRGSAHAHPAAKAAYRNSAATARRAAAGRSDHGSRGAGQGRQASR
ncbi:MAG: hypothetical protein AB7H71_03685 [Alphaproteobacteria bacterium]